MAKIESLEIEIKTNAGQVSKSFNNLIKKLEKINGDTASSNLKKVSDALEKVRDNGQGAESALSKLTAGLKNIKGATSGADSAIKKLQNNTDGLKNSFVNINSGLQFFRTIANAVTQVFMKMTTESMEYIESLNLFTVSMGQYAQSAQNFAEKVSDIMGIDPAEWMRNQGVMMTIAKGFGVAGDKAHIMSQQLTQLAYDLSSFNNMAVEETMLKIQSGFAGELEPLRRIGYDLSVVRLQQEAVNLGIEKSIYDMSQAEKAMLRYHAIMTQVTWAQGDMARTLEAPANQMRIFRAQIVQLTRSLGDLLIPILQKVLPYLIAVVNTLTTIAKLIASLLGIKLIDIDYSNVNNGLSDIAGNAEDIEDGLGGATKKAKELKNALLGIDELNVISPPEPTSGGGSGVDDLGMGGFDFPLVTYDFLQGLTENTNKIIDKMREWLGLNEEINSFWDLMDTRLGHILLVVGAIGSALVGWKIASALGQIETMAGGLSRVAGIAMSVGGAFVYCLEMANAWIDGMDIENLIGMFGGLATAVLGLKLAFGSLPATIALNIGSIGIEVTSIKDSITNGLNGVNFAGIITGAIATALSGRVLGKMLTPILGKALSVAFGEAGFVFAGTIGGALGGVFSVFAGGGAFFAGIWDAIKNGISWLNSLLMTGGGALAGFGVESIIVALTSAGSAVGPVGAVIGALVGVVTAGVIALVQNWEKVKEFFGNLPTFLTEKTTAIKNGVSKGWTDIKAFFSNIPTWFGEKIDALVQWFDNLPGRIGYALGYLLGSIVAWGIECIEWWKALPERITNAIDTLKDNLATWWEGVKAFFTEKVPQIIEDIRIWFSELPQKVWDAIIGTVDKLVTWGAQMYETAKTKAGEIVDGIKTTIATLPETLYNLGTDIVTGLIDGISNAWNSLKNKVTDFADGFLQGFKDALGIHSPSKKFEEVGDYSIQGLVKGLADDTQINTVLISLLTKIDRTFTEKLKAMLQNAGKQGIQGFQGTITAMTSEVVLTFNTLATAGVTAFVDGGMNETQFTKTAQSIITAFKQTIQNRATDTNGAMRMWANQAYNAFASSISASQFERIAREVIDGFNNGIGAYYRTTMTYIRKWAQETIDAYKSALDINSPSKVFYGFGVNTVDGFNNALLDNIGSTQGIMQQWAESISNMDAVTVAMQINPDDLESQTREYMQNASVSMSPSNVVVASGFEEAIGKVVAEQIRPLMQDIADDTKRQADKDEQVRVQIGNRDITNAITQQQRANGYSFRTRLA